MVRIDDLQKIKPEMKLYRHCSPSLDDCTSKSISMYLTTIYIAKRYFLTVEFDNEIIAFDYFHSTYFCFNRDEFDVLICRLGLVRNFNLTESELNISI